MALARFFDRVADAVLPLFVDGVRRNFAERLSQTAITLIAPDSNHDSSLVFGFLLAANLSARFYPAVHLVGDEGLVGQASDVVRRINPRCDILETEGASAGVLSFLRPVDYPGVYVTASGWNVVVDREPPDRLAVQIPAALAAGTVGVGQLFRTVFADLLRNRARIALEPGGFNLVTWTEWSKAPGPLTQPMDLGYFHLVGAGAVGEAAVEVFRHLDLTGEIVVVDDQPVTSTNLQRYVLAMDDDEGQLKTDLVARALDATGLVVNKVPTAWGTDPAAWPAAVDTALVGVDSPETRIAIQASLPRRIYNGFTGKLDLGWSRHEHFGMTPCLACLYWPTGPRPSDYEVLGKALDQHPLRVLGYLVSRNLTVGQPLPPMNDIPDLPKPVGWERWLTVPILDDLAERFSLGREDIQNWRSQPLDLLYRDGFCGGAIIIDRSGDRDDEMVVPLAQQSALAGIMLASQFLIASTEHLSSLRPEPVEARYDILQRPLQEIGRPRVRTERCLCSDPDFEARYRSRWPT